ncbi:uncharacterized protein [Henckelia pumila]|uniref:uncharacterized protein n=1 Tax=Henckelia pumila TaxID=405737 RepID=UPI003C6E0A6D
MIVLTAEKHKYVLTEQCPSVPTAESTAAQKQAYDKWVRYDEMTRCYILESISNVLQQKHQNMETAAKIMESLQEMFEHQGCQARQASIRSIMNMHMKHGMPVRDHMLDLIGQFNVAEVLGAEIKSETQVDMALETLPEMFSQFKVSYNMNKLNMSLTELMKELQNAESVLKTQSGDALAVASVGPSYSNRKGFQVTKELNEGEHTLRVGTGAMEYQREKLTIKEAEIWHNDAKTLQKEIKLEQKDYYSILMKDTSEMKEAHIHYHMKIVESISKRRGVY